MTAPLDLRVLLLVVCASAAFTVPCPVIYRRDPLRRKWFLGALSATLLLAPGWSAAGLWRWPVGLEAKFLEVLDQPVPWLLLMVWWSVAALMMVRTAVRVGRGRRSLLALPLMNDAGIETECHRRATMLNLRRTVSIRMGPAPCASSLGALVMVLPAEASTWPSSQRRAVVSHELTHLQRLDDRLLLLVRLLVDWYWWMPWLSRLQRRYVEAMEESCDDLAARLAGGRAQYVSGLVAAARSLTGSSADSVTAPGQPIWAALLGHSHFASRVHRLLSVPGPSLDHADGRWALLWASVALCGRADCTTAGDSGTAARPGGLVAVDAPRAEPATADLRAAPDRDGQLRPRPSYPHLAGSASLGEGPAADLSGAGSHSRRGR